MSPCPPLLFDVLELRTNMNCMNGLDSLDKKESDPKFRFSLFYCQQPYFATFCAFKFIAQNAMTTSKGELLYGRVWGMQCRLVLDLTKTNTLID